MRRGVGEYFKTNLLSILQTLFAGYSAFLATLEHFWPRERYYSSVPISEAVQPVAVSPMNHYVMPLRLWLAIMILCFLVFISAITRLYADYRSRNQDTRTKALNLAIELAGFLQQLPPVVRKGDLEDGKQITNVSLGAMGRIDKLHYGYMRRFRMRAIEIRDELAENGTSLDAKEWEIDPPELQRESSLKNLIRALRKSVLDADLKGSVLDA